MSWLGWLFPGNRNKARRVVARSIFLRLEHLEDRIAPVVGAFAVPPAIAPGGNMTEWSALNRYLGSVVAP